MFKMMRCQQGVASFLFSPQEYVMAREIFAVVSPHPFIFASFGYNGNMLSKEMKSKDLIQSSSYVPISSCFFHYRQNPNGCLTFHSDVLLSHRQRDCIGPSIGRVGLCH